jgi:hypothetical protein
MQRPGSRGFVYPKSSRNFQKSDLDAWKTLEIKKSSVSKPSYRRTNHLPADFLTLMDFFGPRGL